MSDELEKCHLYYDNINKLRILESDVLNDTEQIQHSCKDYETILRPTVLKKYKYESSFCIENTEFAIATRELLRASCNREFRDPHVYVPGQNEQEVQEFGNIISSLLDVLKGLGENVEKQKMAAIGTINSLKSLSKDRESEQARLQAEITEKTLLLEQLDSEYDALQILEATQIETIEYLTQLR